MESNKISNTYVLGSVSNVLSCLSINVYKKATIRQKHGYSTRISIYNINNVYSEIRNFEEVQELTRTDTSKSFEYDGLTKEGFDVIIYIDSITNEPIGYTEFSSIQGKQVHVDIELNFINKIENDETINFINSLSPAKTVSKTDKNLIGLNINDYTSSLVVLDVTDIISERRSGYTTNISEVLKNKSNILLNSGVIKNNELGAEFVKLCINRNDNDIDPERKYNHYNFGYYCGDLVVYEWNDSCEYNVISLTKRNRFDNSVIYTKSNTNTNKIVDASKIIYAAGKYFVCSEGIYDFSIEKWLPSCMYGKNFFIDPLDETSKIYKFTTSIVNYNALMEIIPEINSVYVDVKSYLDNDTYPELVRKIGGWFVFRYKLIGGTGYSLLGPCYSIYMSESEWENCIILNDTTVILKDKVSTGFTYILINGQIGETVKTEGYKMISSTNLSLLKEYTVNYGVSKTIRGKHYYNTAKINIFDSDDRTVSNISSEYFNRLAPKDSIISETFLDGYRKFSYPYNLNEIPEFIGACGGVLFYKDNNKLNYL